MSILDFFSFDAIAVGIISAALLRELVIRLHARRQAHAGH